MSWLTNPGERIGYMHVGDKTNSQGEPLARWFVFGVLVIDQDVLVADNCIYLRCLRLWRGTHTYILLAVDGATPLARRHIF